ncbi:MAG: LysM peptidoglycan-binding domain-containing protein [Flavobacteriales bacterium]
MKKLTGLVLAIVVSTGSLQAGDGADSSRIRKDDPIVAMIDSLMTLKFLDSKSYAVSKNNKYNFPADSVPRYSESIYRQRIKKMDARTPMEFAYNENVQAYIDLYAVRYRKYTQIILGMTETYFPMFEQMLDKYGIPLELKHLPIVESALNPKAKSPAGAMGLWQFMLPTGKMFGLEVNSMVDERCDPIKATEAACKYLKYLHSLYNDWNMALAAYNAGPGTVNNAIRRSGGKTTYWEIYNYLPRETQGYVPAFIGVNYVFSHAPEHNLYPVEPRKRYFEYDTVMIDRELDMTSISAILGITMDELKFLNPVYKTNVIPKFENKKSYLYLPKDLVGDFLANEDTIYKHKHRPEAEATIASQKVHVVKSGEYLSTIASRYNVSVSDLKAWNNLKSNSVSKGQRLVIRSGETAPTQENTASNNTAGSTVNNTKTTTANSSTKTSTNTAKSGATKTYTVQNGDSLWLIAQKHGVSVEEIKAQNNLRGTSLQAGQKLKIPAKGNG